LTGHTPTTIRLPRALFAFNLSYGQPFRLRLESVNGVRKPIIEPRNVVAAHLRKENEMLEQLVNAL
jgi:hypothetical protein